MATSSTEIANMAISHLGTGKEIANLDTESSEEASSCRRFYEIARDTVLRDAHWHFATKIASLGLVSSSPNVEWDYEYTYPSDCIAFRKIQSGVRNDTRQSRVPYRIAQGIASAVIYTDESVAVCEYTVKETDTSRYPGDFVMALSLKLAFHIAPRLTKGDPTKMKRDLQQEYLVQMSMAKAAMYNEDQVDEEVPSEFMRVRE